MGPLHSVVLQLTFHQSTGFARVKSIVEKILHCSKIHLQFTFGYNSRAWAVLFSFIYVLILYPPLFAASNFQMMGMQKTLAVSSFAIEIFFGIPTYYMHLPM